MAKMHIKAGDSVVLLTGDKADRRADEGKGELLVHKVIAVSPEEGKVLVEGVNVIHKHVKPRRQGETGGIVDAEGAIYACKVALYCPECKKGVRSKVVYEEKGDKKIKVRACAKCGHKFD